VPQPLRQQITAAVRPSLRRSASSAGKNDTVKGKNFSASPHTFSVSGRYLNFFRFTSSDKCDSQSLCLIAQHIQHRGSLLTYGIQISVFTFQHQADSCEKSLCLRCAETFQTALQEIRMPCVILVQTQILIPQITLSVSGSQKLLSRSVVSLYQRNLRAPACRRNGRRQSGGPSADNSNRISHIRLLR